MNRLYASGDFSSSCSSDTDDGTSSDDERNDTIRSKKRITTKTDASNAFARKTTSQNILFKLQNREVCTVHQSKPTTNCTYNYSFDCFL